MALTFDDGPDPTYTPRLLDILDRHGAKATFFMVGSRAAEHQDLLRRVVEAGHDVGNHTWDHPSMPAISGRERRRQIRACAHALSPHESKFFRPPKGHQDLATRIDVLRIGYHTITWGRLADDWLYHDVDWYRTELPKLVAPGRIALLHDALWGAIDERAYDRSPMLDALDETLERASFHFVTLTDLLKMGRPIKQNWFVRGDEDYRT
jgi:peptidoglycan/xylan/chitin deacetylase (PgdA/CDA1 family)